MGRIVELECFPLVLSAVVGLTNTVVARGVVTVGFGSALINSTSWQCVLCRYCACVDWGNLRFC